MALGMQFHVSSAIGNMKKIYEQKIREHKRK